MGAKHGIARARHLVKASLVVLLALVVLMHEVLQEEESQKCDAQKQPSVG